MATRIVTRIEDVKTPGDIFMPPYTPHKAPYIAPCTHSRVRLSTVRVCGETIKVCPKCGEGVR